MNRSDQKIIEKLLEFHKIWHTATSDFKIVLSEIEGLIKSDPTYNKSRVELLDLIDSLWVHLNTGYDIQSEIIALYSALKDTTRELEELKIGPKNKGN